MHRSFLLYAQSPRGEALHRRTVLMSKYGWSEAQAQVRDAQLQQTAAAEGLQYNLVNGLTGNTFDAHRVAHLARARGVEHALVERFYRAQFTDQRSLFDRESLVSLAADAGLDADAVRRMLAGNEYEAEVVADVSEARRIGVSGVPFFLFDMRSGVSGAQSSEVFAGTLARTWADPGSGTRDQGPGAKDLLIPDS